QPSSMPPLITEGSVLHFVRGSVSQFGRQLGRMLARKPPMLVVVALANKMARIVWALMARGGTYRAPAVAA
ncbi:IS110 family transposase, partial [Mesorhizobium sp. M0410]